MTIPLRLTPFGLEQRRAYVQQDRHDEYYEQLLSPSHSRSSRQDCCCVSLLLVGDQNAGKSALLYSLVASKDPRYTAFTSLLPIIQGEFSNRREVPCGTGGAAVFSAANGGTGPTAMESGDHCTTTGTTDEDERKQPHHRLPEHTATDEEDAGTAASVAAEAVEALVCRSRDELPFLDSDVARSAALLSAEDFTFFCTEFGLQTQQQQHQQGDGIWRKVSDSRYVLLHFLEFGGDHLDRMHAFYNLDGSCRSRSNSNSSMSNSTCYGKCTFSSNCSKCDQMAAATLLLLERDFGNQNEAFRALYESETQTPAKEEGVSERFADQAPAERAAQAGIPSVSATRATVLAQSLRRSFKLAAEVPLLVYFVNCSTMFIPPATRNVASATAATAAVELSAPAFLRLLLRLHACCSLLQPIGNRRPIHFACSRLSCRLATCAVKDEVTGDESSKGAAASATGCCCIDFDEKESFRRAVEALKAFASMASVTSAEGAGASEKATRDDAAAPVRVSLDQPFEQLYCHFLSGTNISSDRRNANSISWAPFEDCWGVSACARLKAEDEQLQQCASVVFLKRLLSFVWDVCSPIPLCSSLSFRGVSAITVLERNIHTPQQQEPPPAEQQHEVWGPAWQLCVVSVIAFLVRVLSLLSDSEELAEASIKPAEGSRAGAMVHQHSMVNRRTLPAMDSGDERAGIFDSRGLKRGEEKPAHQHQLKFLQQQDIMTGETGRQLIALFSAYLILRRQQEQQALPNEVSLDLWLSCTDWRDFISDFDPVEQQLQQQQERQCHHYQRKQITLPSTGEIVIASPVEGDCLLLLPAAAAAGAFTPLATELVSLGCCLPCCADGGPWGPVVVQLPINMQPMKNRVTLLLLPGVLEKPLTAVQQQLQQFHYPHVPLKELLKRGLDPCLAAVRLPFHPAVCGLLDSILSSCAREPLPEDFWVAGAAALVAAVTGSASASTLSGAEAAGAESGRRSQLAVARSIVEAAVSAAARNVQELLQQRLQQEILHKESKRKEELGEQAVINSLQLLLHLAGDVVLLQQMAVAATSGKGTPQQERGQQKQGKSITKQEWQHHTSGPYCSQHQLFWTVDLQPPAAEAAEAYVAEVGDDVPTITECCSVQADNSEMFNGALQSLNRELAMFGLVLLPARQIRPRLRPL
ncbi:hypothetical protein, conserved [Eimeria acervulina]|uniref:Uncharacterized protein n=1 Tax=Eimeria acervulina TaxID=5801 RepID=U6G8V6_EIMAC|nr:hypothetical protein, conserved [Eimeria acervulina]CDI76691.1 hypothetical protein, conserved [Eimeria acervulina]